MKAEESKNVLRVGINSIGSPYWQRFDKCESNYANEGKSLLKFVYSLRAIVRSTCTVVLLTIPTHLYKVLNLLVKHLLKIILFNIISNYNCRIMTQDYTCCIQSTGVSN